MNGWSSQLSRQQLRLSSPCWLQRLGNGPEVLRAIARGCGGTPGGSEMLVDGITGGSNLNFQTALPATEKRGDGLALYILYFISLAAHCAQHTYILSIDLLIVARWTFRTTNTPAGHDQDLVVQEWKCSRLLWKLGVQGRKESGRPTTERDRGVLNSLSTPPDTPSMRPDLMSTHTVEPHHHAPS